MKRETTDWIEAFFEYTSFLPSPPIFRKWAAISCIAGALERKVWVETQGSRLFPSMYTILVAPPGVGKSVLTKRVEKLWRALPQQHVAPSSITKAALADKLNEAGRSVTRIGEIPSTITFNSLKILSNELGVLLPSYETEFMSLLTDIYDGSPYAEKRRSQPEEIDIPRPQINLLSATTPSQLNDLLPQGAWDQGFLSRTMLLYSGTVELRPLFNVASGDDATWKNLTKDLKQIGNLYGAVTFSAAAAEAITAWHMAGGLPKPDHPKLQHYNTRRTLHLLKLCMVCSMSRDNSLEVTLKDYQRALDLMIEAEHFMPDIFKSMSTGGDAKAIEECWYFVYQMYAKKKKPVPEAQVYNFLQERVPSHSVERMVTVMVKAGVLKQTIVNRVGTCYLPSEQRRSH